MLGTRYVIVMKIEVVNISIMRIGNGEETIMLDTDTMRPVIPASGITGAFRNYLSFAESDNRYIDMLFGKKEGKSRLFVQDAVCKDVFDGTLELRERVCINPRTATGGAEKFNTKMLGAGWKFDIFFTAEAENEEEKEVFRELLKKAVRALDIADVRLGAQKTNGAGKFEVKSVWEGIVDLFDPKQYWLYLSNSIKMQNITKQVRRKVISETKVCLKTETQAVTPLLVAGKSMEDGQDTTKIFYRNRKGEYVIPGSSLKGILRMQCQKIAEYMRLDRELTDMMFGIKGAAGQSGCIFVSDSTVHVERGKKHKESTYYGIGIDKFTAGVRTGANFSSKPVKARFDLDISVQRMSDQKRDAAVGLLLFALRDILQERVPLGAYGGKGFGRLSAKNISVFDGSVFDIRLDTPLTDGERERQEQSVKKYMKALKAYRGGKSDAEVHTGFSEQ